MSADSDDALLMSPRADPTAVDDRLETYRAKRDFRAHPGARGRADRRTPVVGMPESTGRYVVQRHRASSLHYDFRLEVDGVLASWAVPRGPTLDPGERRLAVRVEDHPLGYYDFEGVIPGGSTARAMSSSGTLGTYEADLDTPDAARAIASGTFKFRLDGEKLRGAFVLVRTAGFGRYRQPASGDLRQKWLLIHRHDADAVEGWDTEAVPHSVKSGLTNDELAARHGSPPWRASRGGSRGR